MIYRIWGFVTFVVGMVLAANAPDSGAVVAAVTWLTTVLFVLLADFQDFHQDWKKAQRDQTSTGR